MGVVRRSEQDLVLDLELLELRVSYRLVLYQRAHSGSVQGIRTAEVFTYEVVAVSLHLDLLVSCLCVRSVDWFE